MGEWVLRVVLGPLTFGLVVREGVVVLAPPCARWATGEDVSTVARYYKRRGARVTWHD